MEQCTVLRDSNLDCILIFLDISKTFGNVSFSAIEQALEVHGVCGRLYDLISFYLRPRRISVRIGSHTTNSVSVKTGIPQGSVLGPLLFNLAITSIQTNDP